MSATSSPLSVVPPRIQRIDPGACCEQARGVDAYEGGDVDNHIRTHGDPRLPDRFWSKCVVDENGCWVWTGSRQRGYGRFNIGEGRIRRAHRVTYLALVGPILDDLEID